MMSRKPTYQIPNQRLFNSKDAARYIGVCADTLRPTSDGSSRGSWSAL